MDRIECSKEHLQERSEVVDCFHSIHRAEESMTVRMRDIESVCVPADGENEVHQLPAHHGPLIL